MKVIVNSWGSGVPLTSADRLSSLIKNCRDIMRKDKGLSGDLDRIPLLTWTMFLKFLDDMESVRHDEAALQGRQFSPTIEAPYRWRDWNPRNSTSEKDDGIHNPLTGDALTGFINQDEAVRPDGQRGPGLFAYLRSLQSRRAALDRRDVVATVFRGTVNRMQSGYLLRDVLDKVNQIHFSSSEEIHTLGYFYESMLKEMRDAAGDSGEFYTPRPVVRVIVAAVDPKPGERVLDPAAGTGGFLAESFEHIKVHCTTVEDMSHLQRDTLFGIEAKPLPYLLAQMNLVLHGAEAPNIDPGNALRFKMAEIGDRDRVDVIVTNPPFGGEEERGIQNNFPRDMQTSETALLFLQFIMRKLRRPGHDSRPAGRAGVVVPNGVLFGTGVAARIKEELLQHYNLHTILRLPGGVFSPYTTIPTNVLFFDRSGPTREVWYYEQALPEGRKMFTKTQPLTFEMLRPLLAWWNHRAPSEQAWLVKVDEIKEADYNLDFKNPHAARTVGDLKPVAVIESAVQEHERISRLLSELRTELDGDAGLASSEADLVPLHELVEPVSRPVAVEPLQTYRILGAHWYAKGLYVKDLKVGQEIRARTLYRVEDEDFVYNRLFAWMGSFALASRDDAGCYVSNEFLCFRVNAGRLDPRFLWYYFSRESAWAVALGLSSGSTPTSRNRLKEEKFLSMKMPVPALAKQRRIVRIIDKAQEARRRQSTASQLAEDLLSSTLEALLAGSV